MPPRLRSVRDAQPDPMQTSVGYIGADSYAMDRERKQAGQKAFRAGLVGGRKPSGDGSAPPRRGGNAGGSFGGGRSGGGTGGGRGRR